MTIPFTPERLAELRHAVTVETWRFRTREDGAALIGEIDRLTARHRLEHERAETLEAENAELHRRLESIRLVASALPSAIGVNPNPENAQTAVASLSRAIDHHAAYHGPHRGAGRPGAAPPAPSSPEGPSGPQWPAEGFEYGFENMDRGGEGPMMIGRPLDDIRAQIAHHAAAFPEVHYALRRRPVGPWETVDTDCVDA